MKQWLERRFRRQFVPHGGAFLYREYDRDVLMEAADVEDLVAEWREAWFSPFVWGGLVLAAGSLAALFYYEPRWNLLAFAAALLVLVLCMWRLEAGQRGVRQLADSLEPIGPGHGRPDYWPNPGLSIFLAFNLFRENRDAFDVFLMGLLLAVLIGDPIYRYWKSRRHPARLAGTRSPVVTS